MGKMNEKVATCYYKSTRTIVRKNHIKVITKEIELVFVESKQKSAYYAKKKYNIDDNDILEAITYHTTGKPDMSLLGKILFIADYIEPNRKIIPGLDEIRKYAFEDIDKLIESKAK